MSFLLYKAIVVVALAAVCLSANNAVPEGDVIHRFACFKVITPFGFKLAMGTCRRTKGASHAYSTELNLLMSENQMWALRNTEAEDLARRLAAEIRAYDVLKKAGIPRSKISYLANEKNAEYSNLENINLDIGY